MNEKQQIPRYLSIIFALALSVLFLVVALSASTYFIFKKKTQGYAMTDAGVVIPLIPLDQPHLNDARVIGFVEECLRASFSHDFENFRLTMATAKACYTPGGAELFEAAMVPLLRDVQSRNLVLSASFEPTVITRIYKLDGVVHWESQTPMVLYRRGTRESLTPLKFRVESVVRRVPLDQHVRGISTRTINLKPA
jgi:hypothetical protein